MLLSTVADTVKLDPGATTVLMRFILWSRGRGRGHELRPEQTHCGTVTSIVSLIDASGSGKYCFWEAILV